MPVGTAEAFRALQPELSQLPWQVKDVPQPFFSFRFGLVTCAYTLEILARMHGKPRNSALQ